MSIDDPTRPRIEVIGHGGAGDFFPGNSSLSIEQALAIGVDRIEVDLQRSHDGDLVLVHDERMHGEGDRCPAVRALRTAELRDHLPGLLTFDELLDLAGPDQPLLLDVKSPGYEDDIITAIKRRGADARSAASCTYAPTLRKLRAAFPAMRLGLSTGHMATGIALRPARAVVAAALRRTLPRPLAIAATSSGATEVMVQYRACSPALVARMHGRGLRVHVWTVDHPARIREVIDLGVDGIISNRPDLVQEALTDP